MLLRALSMMRLLGAVEAVKRRAADAARDAAEVAAIYVLAATLGFMAFLFLVLSLFLGLASVWPPHWAAFAVFVVLLMLAATVVLYARQRPRRRFLPAPPVAGQAASASNQPPLPGEATEEIASAIRSGIRRHPLAVAVGAVAIGLVLGLSAQRDDT